MVVYIDESGDHNLDSLKLDNIYNVFVLCAVCFLEDDYAAFDRDFKALKQKYFDTSEFILHTAELTRPANSRDRLNLRMNNPIFRADFYAGLRVLLEGSRFRVMACVIHKGKMMSTYGLKGEDPYLFSFENLLNRILRACIYESQCRIYPEKRSFAEDAKLELSFDRAKISGTKFYRGAQVSSWVSEFTLKDKKENLSGQQLADLLANPIGRHVIGKPPKPNGNEIPYSLVRRYLHRDDFIEFP
jgi:hypothetical protein